jgi:hypothetical protein
MFEPIKETCVWVMDELPMDGSEVFSDPINAS